RRVRQQRAAGFALRSQSGELGVGAFAVAGVRRAADEAGEVVEVELARDQVGLQVGTRAAGGDAGIPAQVAVADPAGEVVVMPGGQLAFEVAREAPVEFVRRRRR